MAITQHKWAWYFQYFRKSHACYDYVFAISVLACAKSAHVFQKLSYSLCRLCLSLSSLITLPQTVRLFQVLLHSGSVSLTAVHRASMERHGHSHKQSKSGVFKSVRSSLLIFLYHRPSSTSKYVSFIPCWFPGPLIWPSLSGHLLKPRAHSLHLICNHIILYLGCISGKSANRQSKSCQRLTQLQGYPSITIIAALRWQIQYSWPDARDIKLKYFTCCCGTFLCYESIICLFL